MPGGLVEEALGAELVGVGVDLGVVVDQVGVRDQADARRVPPAADLERLLDQPRLDVGQHGPPAQGLLDRGDQVGVAVRVELRRPAGRAPGAGGRGARTPRRARRRSSRGRRRAGSSARRAAPARTSASRPRGAPRAASRARRRARRRSARRSSISSKSSASTSSWRRTNSANGPTCSRIRARRPVGVGRHEADRAVAEGEQLAEPLAERVEARRRGRARRRPAG